MRKCRRRYKGSRLSRARFWLSELSTKRTIKWMPWTSCCKSWFHGTRIPMMLQHQQHVKLYLLDCKRFVTMMSWNSGQYLTSLDKNKRSKWESLRCQNWLVVYLKHIWNVPPANWFPPPSNYKYLTRILRCTWYYSVVHHNSSGERSYAGIAELFHSVSIIQILHIQVWSRGSFLLGVVARITPNNGGEIAQCELPDRFWVVQS